MAFGDALRKDGATVKLTADTAQFNADVEKAEAQWRESVGSMTREALKLDLANDRLKTSLAKYGAESNQAKRATIALRDAEEQAARAADRQTRETRELDRATRSASTGIASMRGRIVGLAAAYVGVHGLVTVIRSGIQAANEEQLIRGQTAVALEALNISYDKHASKIERVIRLISQLGFDDEELLKSFQLLVGGAGDVDTALERVALATGVARGRYIDLESATQIVNKAQLGMVGILRRLGIDIDKNATATEALEALTVRYGKSAEAAANTSQAAADRATVEWENMKEIVGGALLPQLTRLADWAARYFGDAENQAAVQRRVNEAVETGEQVVRGLAGGLERVQGVIGPVVSALGGLEQAVETAFVLGIVLKARRAAASFGLIATASSLTSKKMVADAAVAGRAWDIATRHRTMTVTTAMAGPLAMGGGAKGAGRFMGLARGAGIAGNVLLAGYLVDQLTGGHGQEAIGNAISDATGGEAIDDADYARLKKAARSGRLTPEMIREIPDWAISGKRRRELLGLYYAGESDRDKTPITDAHDRSNPENRKPPPPPTPEGPDRRTEADIQLDLSRARARTATTADDERFLRELRSHYQRQINALERRKKLTDEQKAKLQSLYGQLAGVQNELDGFARDRESEIERQREAEREREQRRAAARKAAREKAEREREAREEKEMERAMAQAERQRKKFAGLGDLSTRAGLRKAALRHVGKGGDEDEKRLTEADFRRLSFEFLSGLSGTVAQFGSNVDMGAGAPSGRMETLGYEQTQLMREQNAILNQAVAGTHMAGTRYAESELSAAGLGVGF